jgi:hypothetical protein
MSDQYYKEHKKAASQAFHKTRYIYHKMLTERKVSENITNARGETGAWTELYAERGLRNQLHFSTTAARNITSLAK